MSLDERRNQEAPKIVNHVTIEDGEVENSIIIDTASIDCGKRNVDSIIGQLTGRPEEGS